MRGLEAGSCSGGPENVQGNIPDSKALWIGTRLPDPAHPFQRALDGHDTAFALSYQAGPDDPPFQKRAWIKATPSLRHGLPDLEDVIRSEAAKARRDPNALASFKSLRLNMGVSDVRRSDPRAGWPGCCRLPAGVAPPRPADRRPGAILAGTRRRRPCTAVRRVFHVAGAQPSHRSAKTAATICWLRPVTGRSPPAASTRGSRASR